MTITRSVLFASLLATAMFGCRSKSDNRDDKNRSAKPVESTTTPTKDQMLPPSKDPWATTGSADQGTPEGTTPTTPGTTPTAPAPTPTTPGTTPGTPTTPPAPTAPAVPPQGSAENIPAPAATPGTEAPSGYNAPQGSALQPKAGSAGSMDTYGSAVQPQPDTGTLDQRGGALNGNSKGDQSNQP